MITSGQNPTLAIAGIDTFTVFEKADDVGGTRRDNAYPGGSGRVCALVDQAIADGRVAWLLYLVSRPGQHRDLLATADVRDVDVRAPST